jgi:beta-lactamase class A
LRGWVVLVGLVLVVGAVSSGQCSPLALLEAGRGLTFSRPPAASTPGAALHADALLQARLDAGPELSRGTLGAYVVDVAGGAVASTNADREFPAASLFKLPILVEVLAQVQLKRLAPDDLLEVRAADWTDGSGVLQARVGDRLPVRELLRLMIQESDNIAALVLLNAAGSENVNATLERLGLDGTRVVDRRRGERGEHVTTPRDMATLLTTIANGQLIDAEVSESALELLELKQASTWLGEGLPWWVKVAHKWGDLPDARHDAGIVFTPRGTYVAVVLTEDARPEEAERAIARVAQAGYDYLGAARQPR